MLLRSSHHVRLAPGAWIEVPHDASTRIERDTGLRVSDVLHAVRTNGVFLAGLEQDCTQRALCRCLLDHGVDSEIVESMDTRSMLDHVRRHGYRVHYPDYAHLFYSFVCSSVSPSDGIAIFRVYADRRITLHDVAPRIKPYGAPWDWFGVYPDPRAFELSRLLEAGEDYD